MSKTFGIFCLALGTALSCVAGGGHGGGGGGANATVTLTCARGVTATLDQVTVYDNGPSNAVLSSLCPSPTLTCSGNTVSMVCVGNDNGTAFAVKGYAAGNVSGPAPWGLNVTDSKGNKQSCLAEGLLPTSFGCTTITGKGTTLKVANSK